MSEETVEEVALGEAVGVVEFEEELTAADGDTRAEVADNKAGSSERVTAEQAPEPAIESLFLQDLPGRLGNQIAKTKLRRTAQGLFVSEELFDQVISVYQTWIHEKAPESQHKSDDKIKRRLFGAEEPVVWYLVEGKTCLAGYLLNGSCDLTTPSPIPVYRAGLLDTGSYIHPRDPLLSKPGAAHVRMSSHQGLVIEIPLADRKVTASPDRVAEFAQLVRSSRKLLRSVPQASSALRYLIEPFASVLQRGRVLPRRIKVLVWEKFRNDENVAYLQFGTLIFAIDGQNVVRSCYERMGKNLLNFYLPELHEGAKRIHAGSQKLFKDVTFPRKRSRFICKLKADGGFYFLSSRALTDFLRQCGGSLALRKSLAKRYTAIDAFSELIRLLSEAVLLEHALMPKFLHAALPQDAKFLKAGSWVFVITEQSAISSCFEIRKQRRPERGEEETADSAGATEDAAETVADKPAE